MPHIGVVIVIIIITRVIVVIIIVDRKHHEDCKSNPVKIQNKQLVNPAQAARGYLNVPRMNSFVNNMYVINC